jgi:hypothetical protein
MMIIEDMTMPDLIVKLKISQNPTTLLSDMAVVGAISGFCYVLFTIIAAPAASSLPIPQQQQDNNNNNNIFVYAGGYGVTPDETQHAIVGTNDGKVHELYWKAGQGVKEDVLYNVNQQDN